MQDNCPTLDRYTCKNTETFRLKLHFLLYGYGYEYEYGKNHDDSQYEECIDIYTYTDVDADMARGHYFQDRTM